MITSVTSAAPGAAVRHLAWPRLFDSPVKNPEKLPKTSWKSSVEVVEVEAEGHKLQNALIASGLSAECKRTPLHAPAALIPGL